MRRALCVIFAVTSLGALFASPVAGRLRNVQTRLDPATVTWDDGGGTTVLSVQGTISSAKSRCVPGRRVSIETGPSETLQSPYGASTTDATGHFTITGSAPDTAYYSIYVDKAIVGKTRCRTTAVFGRFTS